MEEQYTTSFLHLLGSTLASCQSIAFIAIGPEI